jgi:hypothetical protein
LKHTFSRLQLLCLEAAAYLLALNSCAKEQLNSNAPPKKNPEILLPTAAAPKSSYNFDCLQQLCQRAAAILIAFSNCA